MPNPNYERLVKIEQAVIDAYNLIDPTRFFDTIKVDDGQQMLRRKFAQMPMIPAATKDAGVSAVDKFRSVNGQYRVPRHRLDMEMTEDEYRAIMSGGEFEGFAANAAKALAASVAKTLFQNSLRITSTGEVNYYGMYDAGSGNGDFDRPLDADVTTKVTGSWTATTLIASQSLAALKGRVITHQEFNDGTPLIMFYDAIMESVMEAEVPTMTIPFSIRELAQKKFAAMTPIPIDQDGLSIITGVAPTATSFCTIACNPKYFYWLYENAPNAKLEPNANQKGATLTIIHNGGLMPVPVKEYDGKTYKASQAMIFAVTARRMA